MNILVIHGPNLNLLGRRQPELYGNMSLDGLNSYILSEASKINSDIALTFYQSNSEGEIVSKIQSSYDENFEGLIINPAAYTHTSVAIRDAILSVDIPTVEVHISNIYKREEFRHKSFVSGVSIGVISGFGKDSYLLGLRGLVSYLEKR